MADSALKDQQHPQWRDDRQIVNQLLSAAPEPFNLAELARLKIRYQGFPGARDIQADLDKVMQGWGFTEAELFEQTRQIHSQTSVYSGLGRQRDDWS